MFGDKTKIKKLDLCKFTTRPRKSGWWFVERDETEMRLPNSFMSKTRLNLKFQLRPRWDRESWCLLLWDQDENQLLMKKRPYIWLNPDLDETETRLSQNVSSKMRQVQKFCTRVSVPLVSRLRQDRDSRPSLLLWFLCLNNYFDGYAIPEHMSGWVVVELIIEFGFWQFDFLIF